jgi:chromosomal replication initiator protein
MLMQCRHRFIYHTLRRSGMMDLQELWDKALVLIKSQMNETSFNTWVKTSLSPLKMEGNLLTLCTDVNYIKTMLSRYMDLIASSVSQVAGFPVQVEVVTREEANTVNIEKDKQEKIPTTGRINGSMQLNPRYTFDSFVVGSSNRFAHAAALAVAEAPAEAYNPLFLYGGVGLGKTHLMHAIGHFVQQQRPETRLMYITSEEFTNEMISAIQQNRNIEFRDRFRNVDILMVDDIQFIAGRDSTQEEFFHTFNALHDDHKQIVLTSDRPPRDIARLEERLRSRFEWGLIADIQRPDIDTRIAILRKKAMTDHIQVSDEVLELIASRVDSNIRELEGSLIRLAAYSNLVNKPISPALCEEALREIFMKKAPKQITAEMIIETVSNFYNLKPEDITGSSRRREITVPRQISMYLSREMAGLSLPQIGQAFGGRDHSTVLYSCNLVAENIKKSANMATLVEDFRRMIRDGK